MNRLNVQLTTYIGLIPFYFPLIFSFFSSNSILKIDFIEVSIIYGAMISSFISGMQWEQIISNNQKKHAVFPIISFFLAWLHFLDLFIFFREMIIIIALLFNLLIDFFVLNKKRETWFKKMRIIATFVACLSFTINFLLV